MGLIRTTVRLSADRMRDGEFECEYCGKCLARKVGVRVCACEQVRRVVTSCIMGLYLLEYWLCA